MNSYSKYNIKSLDFEDVVRLVLDRRIAGRPIDALDVAVAKQAVEDVMHSIIIDNNLMGDLIVRLQLCGMCGQLKARRAGGCR